jgi:hypothetical protein
VHSCLPHSGEQRPQRDVRAAEHADVDRVEAAGEQVARPTQHSGALVVGKSCPFVLGLGGGLGGLLDVGRRSRADLLTAAVGRF